MESKEKREVKRKIRELKKEMKEMGIRQISFFNNGLTRTESRYNERLFALGTELIKTP